MDILHPDPSAVRVALETVQSLDLSRIMQRVQREHPEWESEQLTAAMKEYYRFLALCLIFPDEEIMPMSYDMDLLWHAHILHTEQYAGDCEQVFGEFLHHEPAETPFPPEGLRERTRLLYQAAFGETMPEDDGFCSADRSQHQSL